MHRNPGEFASILEAAARRIEKKVQHPGQPFPGVWSIGGANKPELVIAAVAAVALQEVCAERNLPFERVMRSYAEVTKNIAIRPKGGPDVMAKNHLLDAAEELRRLAGGGRPVFERIYG